RKDRFLARHLATDDVETLAFGSVHEDAGIAVAPAFNGRSHALREHAGAAAAIERHTNLPLGRDAREGADELRPLVFTGDYLPRSGPLAFDRVEEMAVAIGSLGSIRECGERACRDRDGQRSGEKRA